MAYTSFDWISVTESKFPLCYFYNEGHIFLPCLGQTISEHMRSSLCLIKNRLIHFQLLPLHHMDALCISCQAELNPFCYSFPTWISERQKVSRRQNNTQMTKMNRFQRSNSYFMSVKSNRLYKRYIIFLLFIYMTRRKIYYDIWSYIKQSNWQTSHHKWIKF